MTDTEMNKHIAHSHPLIFLGGGDGDAFSPLGTRASKSVSSGSKKKLVMSEENNDRERKSQYGKGLRLPLDYEYASPVMTTNVVPTNCILKQKFN